ncbi:MAG TPA: LptF/LptG family permease [Bacteroidales bacterium]|nr:LptF/LptG family permease [Bacteroidales bacterium]
MRIKKLHIFILKSFISPLFVTFFIVIFILMMQFLWKYVDDLVGKGLGYDVLLELLFFASATFVPLALPLALLLSAIMTFGNLGENFELTALKASGISLWRIMYPLILLIAAISIAAFFYSNISLPYFNWKFRALLFDIQQQRPELQIKEGVYYNGIQGYVIKIGDKDVRTNQLKNIKIYDHTQNDGNTSVTTADSGYIKITPDKRFLVLTLLHGQSYVDMPEKNRSEQDRKYPFRRDKFSKQEVNIPLEGFNFQRTEEALFRNNFQMMNLKQLNQAVDSMNNEIKADANMLKSNMMYGHLTSSLSPPKDTSFKLDSTIKFNNVRFIYYLLDKNERKAIINQALADARNAKNNINSETEVRRNKMIRLRKHEIEWHKKFTLSLACIIFFFIGAPLGAIIRRGGLGLPLVISVVFFIIYYIVSLTGEKMARESLWPVWQGVWFSSLILMPIGIFLTIKATNDSGIFKVEVYQNTIIKFFKQVWSYLKPLYISISNVLSKKTDNR